ncbi:MAG: FxsA family protein [bacterium]
MLFVLLALIICVPIAEIYLIVRVGGLVGLWPTVLLLLASSVAGALLLRRQGRAAMDAFRAALAQGRIPAREAFDGALVIFGGALLLTPGFLTDLLGLLLLLPPTRDLFRALGTRLARSRIKLGPNLGGWGSATGDTRRYGRRPDDIEGTAEEIVDDPRLNSGRSGTR